MVEMNTPHFHSDFAPLLYDFVNFKRMSGYKYNGEVKMLQQIDRFFQHEEMNTFADDSDCDKLYAWLRKRANESNKTFSTRNSVYRQLHKFSVKQKCDCLPIPPSIREKFKSSSFVPFIFTRNQISALFSAVDLKASQTSVKNSFSRFAPLLFRLLYGTGMRINEALSLTVADVSSTYNVIVIKDGKNDNSRLVPLSDSLTKRLRDYLEHLDYDADAYLFQSSTGTAIRQNTVYGWYREILWKVGIPHQGRGKGPRLHDLRHTFAVHSLQNAVESGVDINAFLPILCTYLGHRRLTSTEKYLRLTQEVFPAVIESTNVLMDAIIPEVSYEE